MHVPNRAIEHWYWDWRGSCHPPIWQCHSYIRWNQSQITWLKHSPSNPLCSLKTSILPVKAHRIHLFDTLSSGSLLSLGKHYYTRCAAYFNAKKVYIFFQSKISPQGVRSASTNFLWKLNKYHNHNQEDEEIQSLNYVIDNPSISERIKFYHASLFLSTLQTLAKTIDAG